MDLVVGAQDSDTLDLVVVLGFNLLMGAQLVCAYNKDPGLEFAGLIGYSYGLAFRV